MDERFRHFWRDAYFLHLVQPRRWNWIHHQSVTVVVDNDWVNAIFDDHGGMVRSGVGSRKVRRGDSLHPP